jgi:hypothetical protein
LNPRRPTALPPAEPATPSTPPGQRGPRGPTRLPAAAPAPSAPRLAGHPTRVLGQARTGPDVPIADLQKRFPALSIDDAERLQQVLRGTVPDALALREALAWGAGQQQRHADLAERALQLAQSPQRVAAQQHVQRLHVLLQEVAEAIDEQLQPGLLSRWRAGAWEVLASQRAEIDQLRRALATSAQSLAAQLDEMHAMQLELRALAPALQAQALAAGWLAEHPGAARDGGRIADTLLQRAAALTSSQSHVLAAQVLRERDDAALRALCAAIQHAVLLLLPAWLEKAAHAGGAAATPTAQRELGHQLQALLTQLPSA